MIKYTEKHTITCYETDASWRLKPASFMNLAQEAAGCHAVHLGFGYDDLIASNTAWILSRVYVEFLDTPKWREDIILNTWHKGLDRLFYLRDFVLIDGTGNVRIKATTSWLVMNLETRRLVRDPDLMEEGTVCKEDVIATPADKVQIPKDVEAVPVYEHVVAYSDIDTNGHTNNAMYMQWAMDAVDYEISSVRPVRNFTINFNHETRPGDRVMLYKYVVDSREECHVFIDGRVGDVSAFCVKIVF